MPREACIHDPALLAILIASNGIIALAYLVIPICMAWVMLRSRVPFPVVWVLFGAFILWCGGTHACAVLVIFSPAYYLEAAICAATAVVSATTAVLVVAVRWRIIGALREWVALAVRVPQEGGS